MNNLYSQETYFKLKKDYKKWLIISILLLLATLFSLCGCNIINRFIIENKDGEELNIKKVSMDIPEEIKDYYRSIFTVLDIKYMTNFLEEQKKGGKGNARQLVYSTPEGRAFANNQDQNAFASIIAIPAVLAIVYIVSILVIMLVKAL